MEARRLLQGEQIELTRDGVLARRDFAIMDGRKRTFGLPQNWRELDGLPKIGEPFSEGSKLVCIDRIPVETGKRESIVCLYGIPTINIPATIWEASADDRQRAAESLMRGPL